MPEHEDATEASQGRRRFRPGKKTAIFVGVLAGLLAASVAGAAYATYDYSRKYEGRILPGASVAGVNIGGMTYEDAVAAVRRQIEPALNRSLEVKWRKRSWEITPVELGARSNAAAVVKRALAASSETSFMDRARMRMLGDRLQFEGDVAIKHPRKGVRGFIQGIASGFDREVRDASLDYSTGWVEITPERAGRKVMVKKSVTAIAAALETGAETVDLGVKVLEPGTTRDSFRQVLLLHIGKNRLYLYEDGEIVREWTVATGLPEFMTPTGLYEVTEKRYMPTWVNPAPDGWGSNMPASIGPGPGNPLGVRALNWSAPAIRFHGTSAVYSLGFNASHGCVRMSNEDVIELYDRVEVGTPIVSVIQGPLNPLRSSSSSSLRAAPRAENTDG